MAFSNYGAISMLVSRAKASQVFERLNDIELPIVAKVVKSSQRKPIHMLLRCTNVLYDGWIYALLFLFLFFQRDWRLLVTSGVGVVVAFALYFITKLWLARVRPCHLAPSLVSDPRCMDRYSFPSGHCMTLAVVGILLCWHHHAFIPVLLGMMMLLCWARVAVAHHYPSDLFAGIWIGLMVAVPIGMMVL
jgi:undecaprenyl-diphosphatase